MNKEAIVINVDKSSNYFFVTFSHIGCDRNCAGCAVANNTNSKPFGPIKYNKEKFDVKPFQRVNIEVYPYVHLIPAIIVFLMPAFIVIVDYYFYHKFHLTHLGIILLVIISLFIYIFSLIVLNKKWEKIVKGELREIL